MIILFYIALCFLLMVMVITLVNAISAPLLKNGPAPVGAPFVSLLVPARNEEKAINRCLTALQNQDYLNIEILVLDDDSADGTAEIIRQKNREDERIKLYSGKPLPPGWTGKNWACRQLALQAKGEFLIFTDADNWHHPKAVSATVGWMQKLDLALFSAFPRQITKTLAEKLIVPSIYMSVYCYLPLWLTYYLPFPSLAAANGQWIAFRKKAYDEIGGHKAVRDHAVEDTALSRLIKKSGFKILTASGKNRVFGRMYGSWQEVWEGFSKNAFGLMEFKTIPFVTLLVLMAVGFVYPYFLLFHSVYALPAVAINILIRLVLALKYRDPLLTVLLHPLAVLLTIALGIYSMYRYFKGDIRWKGRTISLRQIQSRE